MNNIPSTTAIVYRQIQRFFGASVRASCGGGCVYENRLLGGIPADMHGALLNRQSIKCLVENHCLLEGLVYVGASEQA